MIWSNFQLHCSDFEENHNQIATRETKGQLKVRYAKRRKCTEDICLTLFIFSFGCDKRFGKCDRTSQLRTTWVCSSVPVTMLPTALSAAVWGGDKIFSINLFMMKCILYFFRILRKCKDARGEWLPLIAFLHNALHRTRNNFKH